jgi:hypothetical protein
VLHHHLRHPDPYLRRPHTSPRTRSRAQFRLLDWLHLSPLPIQNVPRKEGGGARRFRLGSLTHQLVCTARIPTYTNPRQRKSRGFFCGQRRMCQSGWPSRPDIK